MIPSVVACSPQILSQIWAISRSSQKRVRVVSQQTKRGSPHVVHSVGFSQVWCHSAQTQDVIESPHSQVHISHKKTTVHMAGPVSGSVSQAGPFRKSEQRHRCMPRPLDLLRRLKPTGFLAASGFLGRKACVPDLWTCQMVLCNLSPFES